MEGMKWTAFPDERLEVNGLWWFEENGGEVWRLPGRMKEVVRGEVWELAMQPSGGRIRFASETGRMAIRLSYQGPGPMHNMAKIGQMGVALYADGLYWRPVWPEEEGECELVFFENAGRKMREFVLYLPLYHPVKVLGVGVDEEAEIREARPFAARKPVAFYGSSITQGGCASQAGMSYQAILGRTLDIDFVNLGFSGEGRGEKELAEAFAQIDASVFVVDFAQNCLTVEELAENYPPFLEAIRRRHRKTPIVCITPIYSTYEMFTGERMARNDELRQVIRDAVAARKKAGDRKIGLVEGLDLLGREEGEATVDGSHPNDLGFDMMAKRLRGAIEKALEGKV